MRHDIKRYGFSCVRVLPDLVGKPWNEVTSACTRSLRPSRVRVVIGDSPVTSDAVLWRVTVYLDSLMMVRRIEQEVEVDLPDGVENGFDLRRRMEELV